MRETRILFCYATQGASRTFYSTMDEIMQGKHSLESYVAGTECVVDLLDEIIRRGHVLESS